MTEYKEVILDNLTKFVDNILKDKEKTKAKMIRGLRSRARNSPTLFNIYGYYGFFSFLLYKSESIEHLYNSYIFVRDILNGKNVGLNENTSDKEGYSLYMVLLLYLLFSLKNKESELEKIFINKDSVDLAKLVENLKNEKNFFEKSMKDYNLLVYMKQILSLIPSKSDENE